MRKNNPPKSGFTLVEIMIVVAIIGLLAAIAIPNFVKSRNASQANACVNNLRQIDAAIQEWSVEKGAATGATVTSDNIQPYLGHGTAGSFPYCPVDPSRTWAGSYTLNAVGTSPTCNFNTGSVTNHVLN